MVDDGSWDRVYFRGCFGLEAAREAGRAEEGVELLRRGHAASPSHPLGVWSALSAPQWAGSGTKLIRFKPYRGHILKAVFVKEDSFEALVMIVKFLSEISGVETPKTSSPSYGPAGQWLGVGATLFHLGLQYVRTQSVCRAK